MNEIIEIQNWYKTQCNGDWEHSYGVKIDTLDNPGWSLSVDIVGTLLERTPFIPIEHGVDEVSHPMSADWYVCKIEKGQFKAFSGPDHLSTIMKIFLKWAKNE